MPAPVAAPRDATAAAAGAAKRGAASKKPESVMECSLRFPLPDTASASVLWKVLKTDPAIPGTVKEVRWWSEDPSQRTVAVTVQATSKRDLRSATGSILEQAKLVVRTLRVYPPTSAAAAAPAL